MKPPQETVKNETIKHQTNERTNEQTKKQTNKQTNKQQTNTQTNNRINKVLINKTISELEGYSLERIPLKWAGTKGSQQGQHGEPVNRINRIHFTLRIAPDSHSRTQALDSAILWQVLGICPANYAYSADFNITVKTLAHRPQLYIVRLRASCGAVYCNRSCLCMGL